MLRGLVRRRKLEGKLFMTPDDKKPPRADKAPEEAAGTAATATGTATAVAQSGYGWGAILAVGLATLVIVGAAVWYKRRKEQRESQQMATE